MTDFNHQDDDESFADDDPEDLSYEFGIDRFRNALADQLHHIQEEGGVDIDPEALATRISKQTGHVQADGSVFISKPKLHHKLQLIIDEIVDPAIRARLANETLVLAQTLTDHHREVV